MSFAEVLGAETASEGADVVADKPAVDDATGIDATTGTEAAIAAVIIPAQPAPLQIAPTAASNAAILACLIDATADSETPAVAPEAASGQNFAPPPPPAPSAIPAEAATTPAAPKTANAAATVLQAETATTAQQTATAPIAQPTASTATIQQIATAPVAAAAAPAVTQQPASESDEATGEPEDAFTGTTTVAGDESGVAKPATSPVTAQVLATANVTAPAATLVVATPVVATPAVATTVATTTDAPSSAPGAERAAMQPIEASTPGDTKQAANVSQQVEPGKAQAAAQKTAQASAPAADTAREIKVDATTAATTSATLDAGSPRAPAGEAARPAATHPALQNAPTATIQVYQRMIERVDGRAQRFEVRLDPAELGRVDVRIEVGADKKVHAVLAVHDSAALTDLMRGQRALERALTDAGIDLADGGVRFELSNDSGRGTMNNQPQRDGGASPNVWRQFNTVDVAVDQQAAGAVRNWRPSRLDLVA